MTKATNESLAYGEAIESRDLDAVRQLAAEGVPLEGVAKPRVKLSAMQLAVELADLEAIALLAELGADVNNPGVKRFAPLRMALDHENPSEPVVALLLDLGATSSEGHARRAYGTLLPDGSRAFSPELVARLRAGVDPAPQTSEQQLVAQLAALLVADRPEPWTRLDLRYVILVGALTEDLSLTDADGVTTRVWGPHELSSLVVQLREATYRPDRGAFFEVHLAVTPDGTTSVDYNFTEMAEHYRSWKPKDIAPDFVDDFKAYPRDDSAIPAWLRELLPLGAKRVLAPRR